MTTADRIVDRAADRLEQLARRGANGNGIAGKLAGELAEDAAFLRRLKPSLIVARARGKAPPADRETRPASPSGPQLGERPVAKRPRRPGGGPNPFVVVGVALAVGVGLAKWIDWRGHAHPRA